MSVTDKPGAVSLGVRGVSVRVLTFPSGITVISFAGCADGLMRTSTCTVSLRLIALGGRREERGRGDCHRGLWERAQRNSGGRGEFREHLGSTTHTLAVRHTTAAVSP